MQQNRLSQEIAVNLCRLVVDSLQTLSGNTGRIVDLWSRSHNLQLLWKQIQSAYLPWEPVLCALIVATKMFSACAKHVQQNMLSQKIAINLCRLVLDPFWKYREKCRSVEQNPQFTIAVKADPVCIFTMGTGAMCFESRNRNVHC
jgi:hypothetical protein